MKTVIEMARDQGLPETEVAGVFIVNQDDLGRFAELVRADAIADAVEREREACAKVADDQWVRNPNVSGGDAIKVRRRTHDLRLPRIAVPEAGG